MMNLFKQIKIKPQGTLAYQSESLISFLTRHGFFVESFGWEVKVVGMVKLNERVSMGRNDAQKCLELLKPFEYGDGDGKSQRKPIVVQILVSD